jgi:hypothetical protein
VISGLQENQTESLSCKAHTFGAQMTIAVTSGATCLLLMLTKTEKRLIKGNYWQYQELHRRRRIKRRVFKAAIVGVLCLIIFGVINHG